MTDSKAMTFCSPVNFRAKSCIINILVVTVSFSIFWLEILANSMIPVNRNEGGRGGVGGTNEVMHGLHRMPLMPPKLKEQKTISHNSNGLQSNLYNCQSSVF